MSPLLLMLLAIFTTTVNAVMLIFVRLMAGPCRAVSVMSISEEGVNEIHLVPLTHCVVVNLLS